LSAAKATVAIERWASLSLNPSYSRRSTGIDCRHRLFRNNNTSNHHEPALMIRKLTSGKYRLYSRKKDPKTGRRRNLGTFASRAAAEKHERAVQYFKRH
jgi:hypothetical protein